jgi:tetratricopeptide (TPR) repeat protein
MEKNPENPEYKHLLALCYRQQPPDHENSGGYRSFKSDQRATRLLEELVKDFPNVAEYRYDLSETYAQADVRRPFHNRDERTAAEDRLRRALSLSRELVRQHPNVPDYSAAQVYILQRLAHMLHGPPGGPGPPGRRNQQADPDRLDEAEQLLRQALALQTAHVQRFPESPSNRGWLAIVQQNLAIVLRDRGDVEAARTMIESAISGFTDLVSSDPQNQIFHGPLAKAYEDLAEILTETDDDNSATVAEEKAEQHRALLPQTMRRFQDDRRRGPERHRRRRGRGRPRGRP